MANPNLCIDTLGAEREEPIGLYNCKGTLENPGYRQTFRLRNHRDISIEGSNSECLDFNHGKVLVYGCKFEQENQYFRYDLETQQIFCGPKRDHMDRICIDMDPKLKEIFTSTCHVSKNTQKWKWGLVNETMLQNWVKYGKPVSDLIELKDLNKNLI